MVGELYIGGSGVARGYVANPRQTAERFVPDPHGGPGSRMYATGDRARWRDGGVLELLGRRDGQVKVRGFRVELAEVEAAIGSWPGVREAAVDRPGGWSRRSATHRLYRRRRGTDPRRRLDPTLPSRQASAPDDPVAISRSSSPCPEHLPERSIVAGLLESLPDEVARDIGTDIALATRSRNSSRRSGKTCSRSRPIGVTDDFFDLGGHSLLAVRLAARIEERFGRSLALSDLLLGSTIEELAARIREPVGSRNGLAADRSPRLGAGPAAGPRASDRRRRPLLSTTWPAASMGHGAVLGLQAAGFEGEAEPETDLVRMASRYVDALRAAHPVGPYILGGWSMGGIVAFEMARQLAAAGHDVPLVILIDCSVPVPRNALQPLDDLESLAGFAADLARTAGRETWASLERLRGLDPESIRNGDFRSNDPRSRDRR